MQLIITLQQPSVLKEGASNYQPRMHPDRATNHQRTILGQYWSVLRWHCLHSRHVRTKQPMPARSPTFQPVAPDPTSVTMPTISCLLIPILSLPAFICMRLSTLRASAHHRSSPLHNSHGVAADVPGETQKGPHMTSCVTMVCVKKLAGAARDTPSLRLGEMSAGSRATVKAHQATLLHDLTPVTTQVAYPGTMGYTEFFQSLWIWCRSLWQMPQYAICILMSCSPTGRRTNRYGVRWPAFHRTALVQQRQRCRAESPLSGLTQSTVRVQRRKHTVARTRRNLPGIVDMSTNKYIALVLLFGPQRLSQNYAAIE